MSKICPLIYRATDNAISDNAQCKGENCMFWKDRYGCVMVEYMIQVIATESARP